MNRTSIIFLAASIALVGCKGNTIEGTWNAKMPQMQANRKSTFANGNITDVMTVQTPMAGDLKITVNGTYTLKDNVLAVTYTSANADTSKMTPAARQMLGKQDLTKGLLAQFNQQAGGKISFDSANQFLLTSKAGTVTYTREK